MKFIYREKIGGRHQFLSPIIHLLYVLSKLSLKQLTQNKFKSKLKSLSEIKQSFQILCILKTDYEKLNFPLND